MVLAAVEGYNFDGCKYDVELWNYEDLIALIYRCVIRNCLRSRATYR